MKVKLPNEVFKPEVVDLLEMIHFTITDETFEEDGTKIIQAINKVIEKTHMSRTRQIYSISYVFCLILTELEKELINIEKYIEADQILNKIEQDFEIE